MAKALTYSPPAMTPRTYGGSPSSAQATLGSDWPGPRAHWNVIEFLLDDVGTDQLAMYDAFNEWAAGYAYPNTPNMDAVRAKGMMFTACWAHPQCSPDRAAVLTGKYGLISPGHTYGTGIGQVVNLDAELVLQPAMDALGLAAKALNTDYKHYHVGKWHLGDGVDAGSSLTAGGNPITAAGIDEYRGCIPNANKNASNLIASYVGDYSDWTYTVNTPGGQAQTPHVTTWLGSQEVSDAVDLLPSDDTPFVLRLWCHYAHTPWDEVVPNSELDATDSTMYDAGSDPQESSATGNPFNNHNVVWRRFKAMIEAADEQLESVLGAMTSAQKANTIIIIRADNGTDGTALTSVGSPVEPPSGVYDPNHAKQTVYEQGLKVPLIIGCHPDNTTPPAWLGAFNSTSHALCHTVDIWATIADATLARWQDYQTDGNSLMQVLAGSMTQIRKFNFGYLVSPLGSEYLSATNPITDAQFAVRDQAGYKMVRKIVSEVVQADELYDLTSDPTEVSPLDTENLTEPQADAYANMRNWLNEVLLGADYSPDYPTDPYNP